MPEAVIGINTGGIQPPYDPVNPALANQWQAGTVTAINPANLTITVGSTLEVLPGPTITVARTTEPMILQANSVLPTSPLGATLLEVNGPPGLNGGITMDTYAANGTLTYRRADGTAGSLSAVGALESEGVFQAFAFNGSAYVANAIIQFLSIENQTTAAAGAKINFIVVEQGTTIQATPLVITGASSSKAVQVTGGLSIDQAGTFVANGTTAVTVAATGVTANSVIIPSVNTAGGTLTYPPHVGTITAGINFTMIGAALDTSTYNYVIIN